MKHTITFLFLFFSCFAHSQEALRLGNQYQLKGKIVGEVQLTPHCGTIAWGTVIEFEIIELKGMSYPNKTIGIIITCPEFFKDHFFETGETYEVVFSDKNQASFSWSIPNYEHLKKNGLSFDPYEISVEKVR